MTGSELPYEIRITGERRRHLDRLPEKIRLAVLAFTFEALAYRPRRVGKPLTNELAGLWSARRPDYRVVYEIDDDARIVLNHRAAHRCDIGRARRASPAERPDRVSGGQLRTAKIIYESRQPDVSPLVVGPALGELVTADLVIAFGCGAVGRRPLSRRRLRVTGPGYRASSGCVTRGDAGTCRTNGPLDATRRARLAVRSVAQRRWPGRLTSSNTERVTIVNSGLVGTPNDGGLR
ncbi:MAG: type II toxin-antitoxin system RelE family toxin [Pseudonocardia sp.]